MQPSFPILLFQKPETKDINGNEKSHLLTGVHIETALPELPWRGGSHGHVIFRTNLSWQPKSKGNMDLR